MSHRGEVEPDSHLFAVFLQFALREIAPIVSNDTMWEAESDDGVLDALRGSFAINIFYGLSFNLVGEFIHRNE